jgi:hypothetical protein
VFLLEDIRYLTIQSTPKSHAGAFVWRNSTWPRAWNGIRPWHPVIDDVNDLLKHQFILAPTRPTHAAGAGGGLVVLGVPSPPKRFCN